jgi:hypothetical protein
MSQPNQTSSSGLMYWLDEAEDWFAWHPVRLASGKWVWLEWVFRHRTLGGYPDFIDGPWDYV